MGVLIWRSRRCFWVKFLLHCWNLYGFSSVCVFMCWLRLLLTENRLLHCWHNNGFSPVCVIRWIWRWVLFGKDLLQVLQRIPFLSVCIDGVVIILMAFCTIWENSCLRWTKKTWFKIEHSIFYNLVSKRRNIIKRVSQIQILQSEQKL